MDETKVLIEQITVGQLVQILPLWMRLFMMGVLSLWVLPYLNDIRREFSTFLVRRRMDKNGNDAHKYDRRKSREADDTQVIIKEFWEAARNNGLLLTQLITQQKDYLEVLRDQRSIDENNHRELRATIAEAIRRR